MAQEVLAALAGNVWKVSVEVGDTVFDNPVCITMQLIIVWIYYAGGL